MKIKILITLSALFFLVTLASEADAAPICEAQNEAHCYYIAPEGSDSSAGTFEAPFASINPIINVLQPGDFIYFRGGSYGAANRGLQQNDYWMPNNYALVYTRNLNGEPGKLITFKAYPDELPIIDLYALNPEFNPTALEGEPRDAFLFDGGSYINIDGFEIINGSIHLANNAHHFWIENNHIHDFYTMRDNNGLILLQFAQNVYVYNNRLHDTYERGIPDPDNPTAPCNNADHSGCILNTIKSHFDPEHNGCITTLSGDIYVGYGNETSGPFEFVGNDIYDCPTRFFIKNAEGESVDENGLNMTIKDNYLHGLGYLFYGLRSSNVLYSNNLCKDSCSITKVGSPQYPTGESSEEIINEIDGRNITFKNNVFLDVPYFAAIVGLGYLLENGVYSTAWEDKLKFENNVVFMSEAADPSYMNWNNPGYVFGTSYTGQTDLVTSPVPSKILSRIISKNNCFVNARGEGIGFFKHFLVNESGVVQQVIGHTHADAVSNFNIDGSGDTFPANLSQSLYFTDSENNDFSQIETTLCSQDNIGLTNSEVIYNIANGGIALSETCTDNIQNQDETGIDCGGVCDACIIPITYNLTNLISAITNWLGIGNATSDVNSDGIVNTRDLGVMMSGWGE